jgi:hypothetical protein
MNADKKLMEYIVLIESINQTSISARDISYYMIPIEDITIKEAYDYVFNSDKFNMFNKRPYVVYRPTVGIGRVFDNYVTYYPEDNEVVLTNSNDVHWRAPYDNPGSVDVVEEIYKKAMVDLFILRYIRGYKL